MDHFLALNNQKMSVKNARKHRGGHLGRSVHRSSPAQIDGEKYLEKENDQCDCRWGALEDYMDDKKDQETAHVAFAAKRS